MGTEMENILFSIFMCVYNKSELLVQSVKSVLEQEEASFELLILDNSDVNRENTWRILSRLAKEDSRIKIFRSDENVGWAKGASILLGKASGRYMTFLAADDFLLPQALKRVKAAIEEYEPDMLWVGNKFYEYYRETDDGLAKDGKEYDVTGKSVEELKSDVCRELGETVPEVPILLEGRRAENIKRVMETVFYNSFFHYERIEFLRETGIDFFDSGYGDCAGMTKALAEAGKMVILDFAAYGLTANTSQSRGTFYWDGEQYIFSSQWESIKRAYVRDGRFSFQELKYCATAVLKNEIGNIFSLAEGGKCVNRFMNPVLRNARERICQIEQILENPIIQEMVQFYGRFEYEQEILRAVEKLFETCKESEREMLLQQTDWLGELLQAGYGLTDGKLQRKQSAGTEEMEGYVQALTDTKNCGMFGMGLFLQAADRMKKNELLENRGNLERILNAYADWKNVFVEKIWNRMGKCGTLTGDSKVELAAFCKYILDN